jgi:hypothetical protein
MPLGVPGVEGVRIDRLQVESSGLEEAPDRRSEEHPRAPVVVRVLLEPGHDGAAGHVGVAVVGQCGERPEGGSRRIFK